METLRLTISYTKGNSIANEMIDAIKKSGAFKIEKEEKFYNTEFVEKIKRSMNSKGKPIKTEDLWK